MLIDVVDRFPEVALWYDDNFPETKQALVVRTDFSDNVAWETLCAAIREPVGEFQADVDFVNDADYEGYTPAQAVSDLPPTSSHTFMFIADRSTFTLPDHPILVVDLYSEPGRTFRVIPSQVQSVENNLWLANMDFIEFAEAVDADGIFRGFREEL